MEIAVKLIEWYRALSGGIMLLIAGVVLAMGLLQCFFGYRFFKLWATLTGAVVFSATLGLLGSMVSPDSLPVMGGMALAGLVLGAFVAFKLYKLGGFLICGLVGAILGYYLLGMTGLLLAVLFGLAGLIFTRHAVAVATSVSGGLCAAYALSVLLSINSVVVSMIITVIWTVIGVAFQLLLDGNRGDEQEGGKQAGSQENTSANREEPAFEPEEEGLNDEFSAFTEGPAASTLSDFDFSPNGNSFQEAPPKQEDFRFQSPADLPLENTVLDFQEPASLSESFGQSSEEEWREYDEGLLLEDKPVGTPSAEDEGFHFAELMGSIESVGVVCPHCGRENRNNSKFCSSCGEAIAAAPNCCPSCGAEVEPMDRFCGQCGGLLE